MSKTNSNSLLGLARAYAAENLVKSGPACWVCSLPKDVREVVEVLRTEDGISVRAIVRWLTAPSPKGAGYAPAHATHSKVKHHFEVGHHIKPGGVA